MFYNRFCELCAEHHVAPTTFTENVLGMSKGNVSKWKEGKPPKSDTIQKIAAYFGVSTDYLLGNTDIKNKPVANDDDELQEYLEYLKNREDGRMLFSLAKNATKEDVMRAVAIIEALKKEEERQE